VGKVYLVRFGAFWAHFALPKLSPFFRSGESGERFKEILTKI
jgi:hypothetical protein